MKRHIQIAALLLSSTLVAVAQSENPRLHRAGNEWVQEVKGTLSAGKMMRVKSTAGSIRVQGADQNTVSYTIREHVRAGSEAAARREIEKLHFTALSSGDVVKLQADCEGSNGGYIDFEVVVPAQTATLKLQTNGGAVTARNISGKVEATTGGGNIQLDQISGPITVASGGGTIEIGKVGNDVQVSTGGGNIRIGSAAGRVIASSGGGNLNIGAAKVMSLQTGAGSIKVEKCDGQLKAETGGGSIELSDIEGPAQIETGGGGIRVGPIRGGVQAETGSGPIVATLAPGKTFTDSRLETSVGDIVVYVPDGLGVTVRAAVEVARGQGIISDFPDLKISRPSGYGPRETFAEGSLNGGGPVLHVHTTTGNIEFRRKSKE
ncbi:MAG TPA: hypothetical protein VJN64_10585 [Terriglobales bacterium]|nr:hypothetical protein [Terriglobales bacterium]